MDEQYTIYTHQFEHTGSGYVVPHSQLNAKINEKPTQSADAAQHTRGLKRSKLTAVWCAVMSETCFRHKRR